MTDAAASSTSLTLENILSPLGVDEFVNEYMGKRAVHLPGDPEMVKHLIDKQGVLDLCKNPSADVFAGVVDDKGAFHQILIKNPNAWHMYASGWSLQVEELHFLNEAFMDLCHLIRDGLGVYSGMEAGVMLSNPGKGYPLHFDPNPDVWIFQIFGRKKWTYAKTPAVDRPLAYSIVPRGDRKPDPDVPYYDLERPSPDDLVDVILEPGDVFYFPGGTWHAAEAQEECCHVIIASVNTPWTDVLFGMLKERLLTKADWRQVPEDLECRNERLADAVKARRNELQQIIENLSDEEILAALEQGRASRRKGAYRQQ